MLIIFPELKVILQRWGWWGSNPGKLHVRMHKGRNHTFWYKDKYDSILLMIIRLDWSGSYRWFFFFTLTWSWLSRFNFFIICKLPYFLGKDNVVVSHGLLHGSECQSFHFLDWMPHKAKVSSLPCYITHSGQKRWINALFKAINVKINATRLELGSPIPLSVLISVIPPAHPTPVYLGIFQV